MASEVKYSGKGHEVLVRETDHEAEPPRRGSEQVPDPKSNRRWKILKTIAIIWFAIVLIVFIGIAALTIKSENDQRVEDMATAEARDATRQAGG